MLDDATYRLVSLFLQLLVLPVGGLLWWLVIKVHDIREMLWKEFATKAELTTVKGELRDTMQTMLSARNGYHRENRHENK
jgi:hypothetical protein